MNKSEIPFHEIQGLIVRGYNMKFVRHFVMQIVDPVAVKEMLTEVTKDGGEGELRVTSAQPWPVHEQKGVEKPICAFNLSFTYAGLLALQLPEFSEDSFASFGVFREGARSRAYYVGDRGDSAPLHWKEGFATNEIHMLASLFSNDEEDLETHTKQLHELVDGSVIVHQTLDGCALPNGKIHFGYRDGISQPNVAEFPGHKKDGGQMAVPAWNFVLKDDDYQLDYNGQKILPPATKPPSPLNSAGAAPYQLPTPRVLGMWGSFAAFRVLEQDVPAFEDFLSSQEDRIDPELLAAKFCGRWRSGTPLALAPEQDLEIAESELNNFNYLRPKPHALNAAADPNTVNDVLGTRCPIGSHMRRNNPRHSPVSSDVNLHRIIRRGMPYGPEYDKNDPGSAAKERGLLGLFICASLESQFEFLMHSWVNDDEFAPDIQNSVDPILGDNEVEKSTFRIAAGVDKTDQMEINGFPRFIQTRGSGYVFFPSISALRYMAKSK